MAKAIQGAVIIKDEGSRITYNQKCEKCGFVRTGANITTNIGSNITSSFVCSKCHNNQKVVIQK